MSTDTATTAKFDAILDADRNLRTIHTLAVAGSDAATRARNELALPGARERFNAALDALAADEMPAFMAYRRTHA